MAIMDLIPKMPETERLRFCEWIYECSPCSFCRSNIVDDMAKLGPLADYVIEECLWDADPDTREAAAPSA